MSSMRTVGKVDWSDGFGVPEDRWGAIDTAVWSILCYSGSVLDHDAVMEIERVFAGIERDTAFFVAGVLTERERNR